MSASTREQAKSYLSEHRIPQLFESLLSSLMMERPENPVEYIEKKMSQIKEIGLDNVNWETLVAHLHPYRDNVRRQHVRDGSVYDKEYTKIVGEMQEYEQQKKAHYESIAAEKYEPDVFQLTEAHSWQWLWVGELFQCQNKSNDPDQCEGQPKIGVCGPSCS